jgi:hypothetical protein
VKVEVIAVPADAGFGRLRAVNDLSTEVRHAGRQADAFDTSGGLGSGSGAWGESGSGKGLGSGACGESGSGSGSGSGA